MKNFTCVQDIGNLKSALDEAFEIKKCVFTGYNTVINRNEGGTS